MDRNTITQLAKNKLKNNWELGILSFFLFVLAMVVVSIFTLGLGRVVVWGPLSLGLYSIYFAFIYGTETNWRTLFCSFRDRFEDSFIIGLAYTLIRMGPRVGLVSFLISGAVSFASMQVRYLYGNDSGPGLMGLGSSLYMLIVLAISIFLIVLSYAYAEALIILVREKDTKGFAALRKSRIMMNGRKLPLFIFDLSFIGWFILVALTFGLAGLYVFPYYLCSRIIMLDSIYEASAGMDFSVDSDAERIRNIRSRVAERTSVAPPTMMNEPEDPNMGYSRNDMGPAGGSVRRCEFCGEELPGDAMFCGKCGRPQGGR